MFDLLNLFVIFNKVANLHFLKSAPKYLKLAKTDNCTNTH